MTQVRTPTQILTPLTPARRPRPRFARLRGVTAVAGALAGALAAAAGPALLGGCQSAQGIFTSPADESRQKGVELFSAGNYAEAAGAFTNATRLNPKDYKAQYYLGRAYEALGSYEQAVSAYRTSLDVMSNSLSGRDDNDTRQKVLNSLASAIARGEDRMARPASAQQTHRPATAEEQFVRAKVLRIHGDADSAIEAYAQAARMGPNDLNIVGEYGLYLDQLGQSAKARPVLVKAYQLNREASKSDDEKINAALRRCGVVPGPALLDEKDLAHPALPLGPLPQLGGQDSEPVSPAAGDDKATR